MAPVVTLCGAGGSARRRWPAWWRRGKRPAGATASGSSTSPRWTAVGSPEGGRPERPEPSAGSVGSADVVLDLVATALRVPPGPHRRAAGEALTDWLGGRELLIVLDTCEHLGAAVLWRRCCWMPAPGGPARHQPGPTAPPSRTGGRGRAVERRCRQGVVVRTGGVARRHPRHRRRAGGARGPVRPAGRPAAGYRAGRRAAEVDGAGRPARPPRPAAHDRRGPYRPARLAPGGHAVVPSPARPDRTHCAAAAVGLLRRCGPWCRRGGVRRRGHRRRRGPCRAAALFVEQSLVSTRRTDHGMRYRLLDPIRRAAAERLDAAGESGTLARAHAEHMARAARGPTTWSTARGRPKATRCSTPTGTTSAPRTTGR